MGKIILTIDTEAIDNGDYFTIEKPDDMQPGTLLKHLMWVSSVLVMQAADEQETNNIIAFPGMDLEDVLGAMAQITPDELLDTLAHQPPPPTGVYRRREWYMDEDEIED